MDSITSSPNPTEIKQAPWWLQAVYVLGVPTAICLFLVWFIVNNVVTDLDFLKANFTLHANETGYQIKQNEEIKTLLKLSIAIQQQTCANTATTRADRVVCFGRIPDERDR